MRDLTKLCLGMLLTAFSMLAGAIGTTHVCIYCLERIRDIGWIQLSEEGMTKTSLVIGFTIGLAFFGFISATWVRSWKTWKKARENEVVDKVD